ncbi:MAG: hypothetical protein ABH828_04580 [archaeon]
MFSIDTRNTPFEKITDRVHIYSGSTKGIDGTIDFVEAPNINPLTLNFLYRKEYGLADSTITTVEKLNSLFKTLAETTLLADKVLEFYGVPR